MLSVARFWQLLIHFCSNQASLILPHWLALRSRLRVAARPSGTMKTGRASPDYSFSTPLCTLVISPPFPPFLPFLLLFILRSPPLHVGVNRIRRQNASFFSFLPYLEVDPLQQCSLLIFLPPPLPLSSEVTNLTAPQSDGHHTYSYT